MIAKRHFYRLMTNDQHHRTESRQGNIQNMNIKCKQAETYSNFERGTARFGIQQCHLVTCFHI